MTATIHPMDDARRARAERALTLLVGAAKRSAYAREQHEGAPADEHAADRRAVEDFALWLGNARTRPLLVPLSFEEIRSVFAVMYVHALGVDKVREEYVDDFVRAFERVG